MSLATIRWKDISGEYSSTSFNLETPDGAAFDWDGLETVFDDVGDAIEAVTLCTRGRETINVKVKLGSELLPTSEHAQREAGLRIYYQDVVEADTYHMTIPGPDNSLMVTPGTDVVDWTGPAMSALKTAFEANVLSKDGNAVAIIKGVIIGRHN